MSAWVVCVDGLDGGQVWSLVRRLSAAAMVAEPDPGAGGLSVPGTRNRVFRIEHVVTVIDEWAREDGRRRPTVAVASRGASPLVALELPA
jgi:hypothetical protein